MRPNNRWTGMLVAAGIFAVFTSVAQAQSAGPAFVPALLNQLAKDGWSAQATTALSNAASRLDWSGSQGANPEVVAFALELGKSQDQGLSPTAQAQLALQLALSAAQMKAAGFDEHDTAAAALGAVRTSLTDIQAWQAGGRQGSLGQIIRNNVSRAVRHQVQVLAVSQPAGEGPGMHGAVSISTAAAGGVTPVSGGTIPPARPGR